ncbi:MAG: UTP--glucose-1-phosphate uridylyltransferase GalU [Bacilli bacterium]|nr:UTP--glucose-1-phosphate uridylyltransferase GalU [Bacilli bacterium]
MKKIRKCVIPVAGMGTRFLPATKATPKEMLPIIDKPTIQYIIEEAVNSGIEEILLITSPYKNSVIDHFDKSYELESRLKNSGKLDKLELVENISNLAQFTFIRQGEPNGSGHAIRLAKSFVGDEPFAVMYGDDIIKSDVPVLKQLIDVYQEKDCNVIGVQEVDHSLVYKYGIVEYANEEGKIKRLIEKPSLEEAPSNDAGLGRYIVKPEIFDELDHLERGAGNEYQFSDAMLALMQKQDFYACKFDGKYFDIGNQLGYLKANVEFALDREDIKDEFSEYLEKKLVRK